MLVFYGGELLAPHPTPRLEEHPLSAVCDCFFLFFSYQCIHRYPPCQEAFSSICNLGMRHAVVTRNPLNLASMEEMRNRYKIFVGKPKGKTSLGSPRH
jgi:hypothetical protein